MQVSQDQVYMILQIVEVYTEVQAPLAEEKARLMTRIAELLKTSSTDNGEQLQIPVLAANCALVGWLGTAAACILIKWAIELAALPSLLARCQG